MGGFEFDGPRRRVLIVGHGVAAEIFVESRIFGSEPRYRFVTGLSIFSPAECKPHHIGSAGGLIRLSRDRKTNSAKKNQWKRLGQVRRHDGAVGEAGLRH